MKPFYRNVVTIGIFMTVMLTIVGTASADFNITNAPPGYAPPDSFSESIAGNIDSSVVVVTPAESPSSIYMSINAGEFENNTF